VRGLRLVVVGDRVVGGVGLGLCGRLRVVHGLGAAVGRMHARRLGVVHASLLLVLGGAVLGGSGGGVVMVGGLHTYMQSCTHTNIHTSKINEYGAHITVY
jgi:hypothetical protein